MFAGSDTSAKNPEVQDRLREELFTVNCPESFGDLSLDEIDSLYGNVLELPYLDKVFKESLRLTPPVHSSLRVAGQDDVIPTSQPYKIQKPGGAITVTWWDNLPGAVNAQPGHYSNLMTFSAGPRVSSLGHRFLLCAPHTSHPRSPALE